MAIIYATYQSRFYAQNGPLGDAGGSGGTAEVLIDERYESGTGASQADKLYHDVRTLSSSSNEDLDLTTILDSNGVAIALVEVTYMCIEMDEDNPDEFVVGPGSSNGWDLLVDGTTPVLHCMAGSKMEFYAPKDGAWQVDATHKLLNFANQDSGASGTYTLTILGRSA